MQKKKQIKRPFFEVKRPGRRKYFQTFMVLLQLGNGTPPVSVVMLVK